MALFREVHIEQRHMINRGDHMERKYDATYRFPGSEAVVHVVAPPAMTYEAKGKIIREFHMTAWAAWNSLPIEKRLKINLGVNITKILQRRLQVLIRSQINSTD